MEGKYHRQMLNETLSTYFSQTDLNLIVRANLRQDWPRGQLHPEYHFDDSAFAESVTYINQQHNIIITSLREENREAALAALGRLTHTRQDFYAHSNWISLQISHQGALNTCKLENISLCLEPLTEDNLISGTASIPRYLLYRIPLLGSFVKRFYFPPDSHEAMNLDNPAQGPLFAYAMSAATRHTQLEFDSLLVDIEANWGETAVAYFLGTD